MEEQETSGTDQPSQNGNPQAEATAQQATESSAHRRQFDDVTQAYERARDELNEAVRSLRLEIAKIDLDQARSRAKSWVDENPMLAVFLGVGAGILTGKVLSNTLRAEPPTFSERARHRADAVSGKAGEYADELGAALAYQLSRAMQSAGEAGDYVADRGADVAGDVSKRAREAGKHVSRRARDAGKDFSRKAEDFGRDVSKRAIHASGDASRRAEDIADSLVDSTARSVRVLEDATDELARTLKKRSKKAGKQARKNVDKGLDFSSTVVNAARTAVAAVVVKKASDWMRALR